MKRFHFKLEPALNLKVKQEENQKDEVFKIREVLNRNEEMLESFRNRLAFLQEELRQQQQEAIDLASVNSYHAYLPVLNNRIEQQLERVNMIREQVEKAQEILVALRKERKMLEKLKERHLHDYRREEQREEQKLLDEMANRLFFHHDSAINGGY